MQNIQRMNMKTNITFVWGFLVISINYYYSIIILLMYKMCFYSCMYVCIQLFNEQWITSDVFWLKI